MTFVDIAVYLFETKLSHFENVCIKSVWFYVLIRKLFERYFSGVIQSHRKYVVAEVTVTGFS